ncbi:MAG: hypothetical protein ABSC92_08870 [Rhizomicrobium sp.]|jgi:hypothetical protein
MRERLASAIEDFVVDFLTGIAGIPARVATSCRDFVRLLGDTFDGAPGGRHVFEGELGDLLAPHLQVLVHKRTRMFVAGDEGAAERWHLELRCFMDGTLLPVMGTDRLYAERNRGLVVELIDRVVAREQSKPAERSTGRLLPNVTPFDSSWVT